MKKSLLPPALVVLFGLFLVACDNSDFDPVPAESNAVMSANIDGGGWSADRVAVGRYTASSRQEIITADSTDSTGAVITYPIDTISIFEANSIGLDGTGSGGEGEYSNVFLRVSNIQNYVDSTGNTFIVPSTGNNSFLYFYYSQDKTGQVFSASSATIAIDSLSDIKLVGTFSFTATDSNSLLAALDTLATDSTGNPVGLDPALYTRTITDGQFEITR
ncbi:MAG: hypothetical protein AAF740_02535 [Bacteroidota bacterium]